MRIATSILLAALVPLATGCGGPSSGRGEAAVAADQIHPLLPGMQAPAFSARRPDGSTVEFSPEQRSEPAVISFYRGGWSEYCNQQLALLRESEATLRELGYEVLFLSPEEPELLRASLEDPDLSYELLSDSSMTAARAFGVAFTLDENLRQRYLQRGIDLAAVTGTRQHQLPVPATFIVGVDGRVAFMYANPDYRERVDPQVLLTAARRHLARQEN